MNTLERIEKKAKEKKVKKKEIANICGLSDSCFGTWKNGQSESYKKHLPEIAQLLGTTVEYLTTGKEAEEDPILTAYRQAEEHIQKAIRILLRIEP